MKQEAKPIKILLADDHALIRTGMKNLLEGNERFLVVGEAANGEEAVQKARDLMPDVVIIDISMPNLSGIEATKLIRKNTPVARVLVLTMHENAEYVYQIFNSGASGYLLKNAGKDEITEAILAVARGDKFYSARVSELMIAEYVKRERDAHNKDETVTLTKREHEVLDLIARGLNNQQIADRLFISPRTADTHRTNIMQKLDIHDAGNLVRYALEHGYGGKSANK